VHLPSLISHPHAGLGILPWDKLDGKINLACAKQVEK